MKRAFGATLIVVLGVGRAAWAQPSGQDIATAEALFEDGKRLMQQGKYEEGCPKLVESQRLDPGGGTLLAIGLCHEGQGRTATAWADFAVALGQARKDNRADREKTAEEHIKTLEPKLTRVRVSVAEKTPGIEVRRDGALVGEAQWSTALPIDPGDHLFEATAPGKMKWSATIAVAGEGKTVEVRIPALNDDAYGGPKPAPTATTEPQPNPPPAKPPPKDDSGEGTSSQVVWAGIAGGVGIVGVAIGTVFGVSASSKWSDAKKTNDGKLAKDAGSAADLSTVFFTIGAVGLVAGAVLYFTAPSSKSTAARRLLLEGTF